MYYPVISARPRIQPWLSFKPLLPLLLALIPGLATYLAVYLEIMPGLLYPTLKIVVVLLPFLVWRLQSTPKSIAMDGWWRLPSLKGLVSGLLMSSTIILAYFLFFQGLDSSGIVSKLNRLDLLGHYVLVGVFISCVNSAIEEWFWRGFLQQQFRRLQFSAIAIIVTCGVLFGVHHYFTLLPYFPSQIVLLFTLVTMVAGGIWSYQRTRGWSLVDCYIGHVCADLAIIYIGWLLIR